VNRRALLSGVLASAVGLAGCGGPESDRQGYDVPEDDPGSPTGGSGASELPDGLARIATSTFGPDRRLAVSLPPRGSPPDGTEVTAGFVDPASAESPARLWVGLTNVTDDELQLEFGPTPPFSAYHGRVLNGGRSGPRNLLLVPDDARQYASYDRVIPDRPGNATRRTRGITRTPETGPTTTTTTPPEGDDEQCWRADAFLAAPLENFEVTMAPGETVGGEYAVLYSTAIGYCPPRRGGYLFEDRLERLSLVVSTWDPSLEPAKETGFDRSVPALPGTDGTVWYHRIDRNARVYLEPTTERVGLPTDSLSVTFQNYSVETLSIDPDRWGLYRLVDGDWTTVVEPRYRGRSRAVAPGGAHRLTFRLSSQSEDPGGPGAFVGGLEPGLYAVRHGSAGTLNTDGDSPLRARTPPQGGDARVAYAALVEVA